MRQGPKINSLWVVGHFDFYGDWFSDGFWQNQDMPDQSSKKPKRPRDLNVLAYTIAKIATEGEPETPTPEDQKNPHAVALRRLGGQKSCKARAEKLTPEERKEIARKAANARWGKKVK